MNEHVATPSYETPRLLSVGSFAQDTGFLARHGNDRLIFSKN